MRLVHIKKRWRGYMSLGYDTWCGVVVRLDYLCESAAAFHKHASCPYCEPSTLCRKCVEEQEKYDASHVSCGPLLANRQTV